MKELLRAPNWKNPRKLTDEKMETLKRALILYGDLGGIVFNTTTGKTVGGHQRLKAFQDDEAAKVKITDTLKEPDAQGTTAYGYVIANGTRYNYREVAWDATKETAAMLAANRFGGEWDLESLEKVVAELSMEGFDLDMTGFDAQELEQLLALDEPDTEPEAPAASKGSGKVDKLYLTVPSRQALDEAKRLLDEADDSKAIERIALAYIAGHK